MSDKYRIKKVTKGNKNSGWKKYQEMIVGKPGFFQFIVFEFITVFISPFPGAVGIILRKIFYPLIFRSVGKGVVFGRNIAFRHPGKISIGDSTVIDDNCLIDAKGSNNNGITIGNGVFIGRNSIISCKDGDIILEDNVNIGFNCEVYSLNTVKIGSDTLIAAYCYLIGGGVYDISLSDQPMSARPIFNKGNELIIGRDCWLGAGVKVLDGVKVGTGAVIGAGAVVSKDIPDNAIAVGIPAKVIKSRTANDV